MAKKFEKKLLSSAIAVALASGVGFSGAAYAIQVSEKGIGQVLMSPLYLAEYGYNSKVAIVNTKNDIAVKTRVALRSHVSSLEFDFLCYMSPSDVCRFEIVRGDDGQAYIKSTDDSLLANIPTTAPDFRPVFASQCAAKDASGNYVMAPTGYGSVHFCKDGALVARVYDYTLPTNIGDVWNTINDNPNAPDYVYPGVTPNGNADDNTNDPDSVREGIAADAHPSNPDTNEIGHLEVVAVWGAQGSIVYNSITNAAVAASQGQANPLQNTVIIREGMSKADLYKIMGPLVPDVANGPGIPQNRNRLATRYAVPLQNESNAANGVGFADGRLNTAGVCQVDPILASDTLQGSSIMNALNVGAPCFSKPNGDTRPNVGVNRVLSYDSADNGSRIRSTDPRWIRLTGTVEMDNGKDRMGIRMAALDGDIWDNLTPADHTPAYGMFSSSPSGAPVTAAFQYAFDGRVISNPTFDTNTSATLQLGQGFAQSRAGFGDAVASYDNIIEIENSLAATALAAPYENDGVNLTNVVVTFPTKYRHRSNMAIVADNGDPDAIANNIVIPNFGDGGDVCASENLFPGLDDGQLDGNLLFDGRFYYPPFRAESSGSVAYAVRSLDDQENAVTTTVGTPLFSGDRTPQASVPTITDEVNYMWMNWPYASGWFTMTLPVTAAEPLQQGCQYAGVPVLAYAHKTQRTADGGFINSWLLPLTKDKGTDWASTTNDWFNTGFAQPENR